MSRRSWPVLISGMSTLAVAREHVAGVAREGVEMAQVGVGHRRARALQSLGGGAQRAVGAAPAEDEQVAALGTEDLQVGDVVGDAGDLARAQVGHALVVVGVVGDVAA